MKYLIAKVAAHYKVTEREIKSKAIYTPLPDARHMICMVMHRLGKTNREIEKALDFEQSRVSQSLSIARRKMDDPDFAVMVFKFVNLINK